MRSSVFATLGFALVTAFSTAARAEPSYLVDGVIGTGTSYDTRIHDSRGLLDAGFSLSALFGRANNGALTLRAGGTIRATFDNDGTGYLSMSPTLMLVGRGSAAPGSVELSSGPLIVVKGETRAGIATRVSVGLFGSSDFSVKVISLRLYAEHRAVFGAAETQFVFGIQMNPLLPFLGLALLAFTGGSAPAMFGH